jgi:hypothetical protein
MMNDPARKSICRGELRDETEGGASFDRAKKANSCKTAGSPALSSATNRARSIMDAPTDFQVTFRIRMLERMMLRAMLQSAAHGRSLAEARRDSIAWLEDSVALVHDIVGNTRGHAALDKLYAAEAREVIDDLIAETNALAQELEAGREGKEQPKS